MGFNTAVVLLNDRLNEIEGDADFGRNLAQYCRDVESQTGRFYYGPHGSVALSPAHADLSQIVAVGGNTIRRVGFWDGFTWVGASDLEIVRAMARALGYRLTRIPGRAFDEEHKP